MKLNRPNFKARKLMLWGEGVNQPGGCPPARCLSGQIQMHCLAPPAAKPLDVRDRCAPLCRQGASPPAQGMKRELLAIPAQEPQQRAQPLSSCDHREETPRSHPWQHSLWKRLERGQWAQWGQKPCQCPQGHNWACRGTPVREKGHPESVRGILLGLPPLNL